MVSSAKGSESGTASRIEIGMDEVFELRRENHVHEDHRQAERDEEVLEGLLQGLGAAGEDHLVIRRAGSAR